jgi:hypothetical protein
MAGRNTNLALAGLTTLAVLSGFIAFGIGTPAGGWLVVAHGLIGLSLMVLIPWKWVIARRGMQRHGASRWLSIVLAVAVLLTIASGIIQVVGATNRIGPFTNMQVHVGAGLVALALTLVHLLQRPVRPRSMDLNRRNALRSVGLLGASGALYLATEGLWSVTGAPGENRRFTGSHSVGDGARVPPTQWLNDRVQRLDADGHRVEVMGSPYAIDVLDDRGDRIRAILDCTGGWHAERTWSGTRLDFLLGDVPGQSIVVRSVTGYWRRFPIDQASGLWLVTRLEGEPLEPGNGAPVRLVAPGRRGFWWVKWVQSVETDDLPPWWQPPLPTA